VSVRELDDREEQTRAMRALLAVPFVDGDDPTYALIRRHERALARTLQATYGYQLEVGSTAARASGPPTREGLERPIRVRPASVTGRQRPPDEWPALSDRACLLLVLTLVALERGGAQTAIGDLAKQLEHAGADVDPPVSVDFRERRERVAFADALDLLCDWGVLEHTSGSHGSFGRREQGDDEALFTVDHRRLALLLHDPTAALHATSLEHLLDETGRHSPTAEGENRARAERLARRLTEDPALVLTDLDPEDRAYFLGQRARIESAVESATGYAVERRAEGSALIVDDRAFTDLPFPTNATIKQVALLVCDTLTAAGTGGEVSAEALRGAVVTLMSEHGAHWGRDRDDPAQVAELTDAARDVLLACGLAAPGRAGGLVPRPIAARFRSPTIRSAEGSQ
jgi:uncharacterized protein (TIGR02678 family)